VQSAGGVAAVQLKAVAVDEDPVAVSPFGAGGSVVHDTVAAVSALAWAEADEEPAASTASTK
jgi:hypothetical protein